MAQLTVRREGPIGRIVFSNPDKLNALTNDATPPADACNTWRALYSGIAQLNDDLINHIHLENNVLFPAFEAQAQKAMGGGGCGGSGGGCQCG